jgi:hypothetical protein
MRLRASSRSPDRHAVRAATTCADHWASVPGAEEVRQPRAIAAPAADDVWIVGTRGIDEGVVTTGAEHWDGERWNLVPTENVGTNGENALNDVDGLTGEDLWAVNGKNIWAVGWKLGTDGIRSLILRWDVSSWTSTAPWGRPGARS